MGSGVRAELVSLRLEKSKAGPALAAKAVKSAEQFIPDSRRAQEVLHALVCLIEHSSNTFLARTYQTC